MSDGAKAVLDGRGRGDFVKAGRFSTASIDSDLVGTEIFPDLFQRDASVHSRRSHRHPRRQRLRNAASIFTTSGAARAVRLRTRSREHQA